ncbi:MAG: hypothetical protein KIS81_07970 [Maricaulaceae bacterium]|nr:hypothetical protein [Maricaulaceae bacterium]
MLKQRVITAIVLLALLLPALFAASPWPFAVLTLLLIGAAGWEWGRLNNAGAGLAVAMGVLLALAGAAALALGMALFAPGWVGGGDAKLFAAAALWFGWPGAGEFALKAVLAGGALALILIILRRLAPATGLPAGWVAKSPLAEGAPAPYGIALAAGALWTLPNASIFAAAVS